MERHTLFKDKPRDVEIVLYITSSKPTHQDIAKRISRYSTERFGKGCILSVIDMLTDVEEARRDQVTCVPALVRRAPAPVIVAEVDMDSPEKALDLLLPAPKEGH